MGRRDNSVVARNVVPSLFRNSSVIGHGARRGVKDNRLIKCSSSVVPKVIAPNVMMSTPVSV